jgi:hypothetical protein
MNITDIFHIITIAFKESIFMRIVFVSIIYVSYILYKNPREDFYNDKKDY